MDPVTIGAKFYNTSTSFYANTIIEPSVNVNGVIIRTCVYSGVAGGIITTGTAQPTGTTDSTKPRVAALYNSGQNLTLPYQIYLPAGYGLWSYGNGQALPCAITYDLL